MAGRFTALALALSLVASSCRGHRQEWVESRMLSEEGGEIAREEVRLEIPPGGLKERIEIQIGKRTRTATPLPKGYSLAGDVAEIHPRGLVFLKPSIITLSYRQERIPKDLGVESISICCHNGEGWVRMGDSNVDTISKTISCPLWHTAQLSVVSRTSGYGIVEHEWKQGATPLLLIHGATPVSWEGLRRFLREKRYPHPVWVFECPADRGVRESAQLLSDGLAKLHTQHGDFKINIVAHDIGGLVALHYALREEIHHDDIEKVVITIATPHHGTAMADPHKLLELLRKATDHGGHPSPQDVAIIFSFADALGSKGQELEEGSELLEELKRLFKEYRRKVGQYVDQERPIFRVECFSGDMTYPLSLDSASIIPHLPSELSSGSGDTYVSVESTKLSPIENAPFHASHWQLMQDRRVWTDILGYLELEPFSWPKVFHKEISSSQGRMMIAETWEREFKLNQNDPRSFELVLDFGRNLLNSCEPNAILFTNGDYDTYPLWWAQEKEGLRKDVAVANLSLLNTSAFIKYLKGPPHLLPISFSEEEIDSLKPVKTEERPVYVSEQVADDLIATNRWERPIYYAITCRRDYMRDPRALEGLVYRLLEEAHGEEVDAEKCRENLYQVYSYKGLLDERGEVAQGLDPDMERILCWDYSAIHFQMGQVLKKRGELAAASKEFEQAIRFSPRRAYIRSIVASQYEEMGRLEEAERELKMAIALDRDYFPPYRSLASIYKKTTRQRIGIRLVASWLERHPDDKEAIEFLREYAE